MDAEIVGLRNVSRVRITIARIDAVCAVNGEPFQLLDTRISGAVKGSSPTIERVHAIIADLTETPTTAEHFADALAGQLTKWWVQAAVRVKHSFAGSNVLVVHAVARR